MINEFNELMANEISLIKKDGRLSLLLLKLFSVLYLNGSRPSGCGRCMEDYYNQLKSTGFQKITTMEKSKKTCKMKPGLIFVRPMASYFKDEYLTDAKALGLLANGVEYESLFIKLPDGYKNPEKEVKAKAAPAPKKEAPKAKKSVKPEKKESKTNHPDII